ncbi:MAG: type II toxin-antitoxin system Phd/YefM family antitoxin [Nitrospirae bacterium]|nr:type II toxin-antitoxin system Phd/YefM family antitoxin [Nitrospirota bacterium]
MNKIVSITELREKTLKVLDEASEEREPIYVVARSKPKVVMESIEVYQAKEDELTNLRRKVFELETLQALKEAKEGKGKVFKSVKLLMASIEKKK